MASVASFSVYSVTLIPRRQAGKGIYAAIAAALDLQDVFPVVQAIFYRRRLRLRANAAFDPVN
jgi:hypothetical protein